MRIGEQIKNYRKTAGLTQEQVANYLGVSTPAVNKWEKGNTYPDISLLPALARLLKICSPFKVARFPLLKKW